MKNFKRVISAVIALALSASTLVAVSASKFSDVDDADNYAGAINALTALDIIHGYEEEGEVVFKPEGDITRAEAATMIVGALNMMNEAKAAAGTSKFTDVNEKASWASGYVNVGVAQGFINGMDDTTFAPQENVTYAQMCVMLTLITGYGDYAKAYGGYPTGYTTIANQTGISKGVAVAADTPLKRGQVAQVLYNAMTTPVLGVKNYSLQGNEYAVSDGDEIAFKTILSSKFKGYEAEMKIEAVPKSDTTLDKDQVKVSLTDDAYLDEVKATSSDSKMEKKYDATAGTGWIKDVYDDFGVSEDLYKSGKGILVKDSNKKWHLVYFEADENETAVVDAADFLKSSKGGKSVATDKKVTFGTKDYPVNATAGRIYVNGVDCGAITDANMDAILPYAQGEVKFIDDNESASGYEKIMVASYTIAKVTAVNYTSGTTSITMTQKAGYHFTGQTFSVIEITDDAVEDGDVAITVKNADGEAVKLSSIKKGDIIGFAISPKYANVSTPTTVKDPSTIDIVVTDETISGKVTAEDKKAEVYTIDNEVDYKTVVWVTGDLTVGSSYTLTLDPFGRIYGSELESDSARYAVAEKYDKDYGVQLILPDGTSKYYEMEASTADLSNASAAYITAAAYGPTAASGTAASAATLAGASTVGTFEHYIETANANKPDLRVVQYTLKNSTGKISSIKIMNKAATLLEYKGRNSKLDGKSIIDTTGVLDASKYIENNKNNISDYAAFATSSFVDKTKYKAAVFSAEGNASFIILTEVGKTITAESRFAVVKSGAVTALTDDGDTCYKVGVLYDGEEQDMLFEYTTTDAVGATALNPGDAFFFLTDNEGLVKSYVRIYVQKFTSSLPSVENGIQNTTAFKDLATLDAADGTSDGKISGTNGGVFTYETSDWDYTFASSTKDCKLVYAIITDADKGVEFAEEDVNGIIDLNDNTYFEGYDMDSDCLTYRYGIKEQTVVDNQDKAINVIAPTASTLDGSEVAAKTGAGATTSATKTSIYNLGYNGGYANVNYALALIVDGDIVEIYTIAQK
jgi:hypothetical protein